MVLSLLGEVEKHVRMNPMGDGVHAAGCCPFHPDKMSSFIVTVNAARQSFRCYECEVRGGRKEFLRLIATRINRWECGKFVPPKSKEKPEKTKREKTGESHTWKRQEISAFRKLLRDCATDPPSGDKFLALVAEVALGTKPLKGA